LTPPLGRGKSYLDFLAFFWFFVTLILPFFNGIHPQPQEFFFSAIFITSFQWIVVHEIGSSSTMSNLKTSVKYLSDKLNIIAKKFIYFFWDSISFTLSRTILSSFRNSFSYLFSDSKLESFNSFSLNLPVPPQPHVQISFNICRQFSIASSSIA